MARSPIESSGRTWGRQRHTTSSSTTAFPKGLSSSLVHCRPSASSAAPRERSSAAWGIACRGSSGTLLQRGHQEPATWTDAHKSCHRGCGVVHPQGRWYRAGRCGDLRSAGGSVRGQEGGSDLRMRGRRGLVPARGPEPRPGPCIRGEHRRGAAKRGTVRHRLVALDVFSRSRRTLEPRFALPGLLVPSWRTRSWRTKIITYRVLADAAGSLDSVAQAFTDSIDNNGGNSASTSRLPVTEAPVDAPACRKCLEWSKSGCRLVCNDDGTTKPQANMTCEQCIQSLREHECAKHCIKRP